MNRIVFITGIALALIAAGCGSDNPQPAKASVTPPSVTPPSAAEQPKPSPIAPVDPPAPPRVSTIPATVEPKPAHVHKVRRAAQASAQVAPVAVEDSRAVKLADEILKLPLQERLAWSKQEFAKRGIGNVHDDQ
jgi:hypothetical protein